MTVPLAAPQIYYCVTLHPDDGKQNVLMAGCSDKKIYLGEIEAH